MQVLQLWLTVQHQKVMILEEDSITKSTIEKHNVWFSLTVYSTVMVAMATQTLINVRLCFVRVLFPSYSEIAHDSKSQKEVRRVSLWASYFLIFIP